MEGEEASSLEELGIDLDDDAGVGPNKDESVEGGDLLDVLGIDLDGDEVNRGEGIDLNRGDDIDLNNGEGNAANVDFLDELGIDLGNAATVEIIITEFELHLPNE